MSDCPDSRFSNCGHSLMKALCLSSELYKYLIQEEQIFNNWMHLEMWEYAQRELNAARGVTLIAPVYLSCLSYFYQLSSCSSYQPSSCLSYFYQLFMFILPTIILFILLLPTIIMFILLLPNIITFILLVPTKNHRLQNTFVYYFHSFCS